MKQAGHNPVLKEREPLSVNALDEISPEETHKLLKMKRVDGCKAKLIVSVRYSRFIHFSVYEGHVHYYVEFKQVVVTTVYIS